MAIATGAVRGAGVVRACRVVICLGVLCGGLVGTASVADAAQSTTETPFAEASSSKPRAKPAIFRSPIDHQGVDILSPPGESIVSPMDGTIFIRDAYMDRRFDNEFQNIWVKADDGTEFGLFFVAPRDRLGNPLVKNGDRVRMGDPIGTAQDRGGRESVLGEMKNHIHIQIHNRRGKIVDPTPLVKKWQRDRAR